MAPEIFEKDENYSFPVDVYSFGLIIWEVTTREQPYIDIKPHFKVREPAARMNDSLYSSDNSLVLEDSTEGDGWRASVHSEGLPPRMVPNAASWPVPSYLSLQTHRFLSPGPI